MEKKRIVYYTASGCKPCEEVTRLINEGRVANSEIDEIDMVDIETDEGFERFTKEVLSKGHGAAPSAYLDGKKCQIEIHDEEIVVFNCPKDDSPASAEEISSPPEDTENKIAS